MSVNGVALNSLVTALAPAVWGSTYIVTTELLPPDRPLLAATLRALPAGLVLVAVGRTLPSGVWWGRATALGVLNIGAFFYLLFVAAYHLPGGVAALVGSVQPTVVLVLAAVILKQPIQSVHIVSCVVGIAGIGLLVLRPDAALDTVGLLAGLGAALSMGLGIVLTKLWGRPDGVGVLTFTGWQLTVGGALLLPVMLTSEGLPATHHRHERRRLRLSRRRRRADRLQHLVPRDRPAPRARGLVPGLSSAPSSPPRSDTSSWGRS